MSYRRTLRAAPADLTNGELWEMFYSPDAQPVNAPRSTPNYTARLKAMQAEAERGLDSAKQTASDAGKTFTDWLKANKLAVYAGAAALFALALMRSRR